MIVVRDREAGNVIEIVESIEAGKKLIEKYEKDDQKEGIFERNFYEVAEIENE